MKLKLKNSCLIRYSLLFIFLIITENQAEVKNIIFDLNGVLFTNKISFQIKKMGFLNIILYTLKTFKNPLKIQKDFFTLLEEVFPKPPHYPSIKAQDNKGNTLPYIMNAWLAGEKKGKTIIASFKRYLLHNNNIKPIVKKLFFMLAQLIFNPKLFVQAQIPLPGAEKIVRHLKKQGYSLFILSNWDADSFAILKNKYSSLFEYFDGVIISSKVKINKPNKKIYSIILSTFKLKAEETVFIDDQQINLDAAKKLGIKTILCPQKGLFFKKPFLNTIEQLIQIK